MGHCESGKLLQSLNHQSSPILHYYFHTKYDNQTLLISISNDSSIRYWNMETGELLVTKLLFKDGNSLFYTPENYYMVTDEAVFNYIAFKKNHKMYDFDQFDLKFNRPDIILERLKIDPKNPNESEGDYQARVQDYENKIRLLKNYYENRVRKNGFDVKQLSGENRVHAPEISNNLFS